MKFPLVDNARTTPGRVALYLLTFLIVIAFVLGATWLFDRAEAAEPDVREEPTAAPEYPHGHFGRDMGNKFDRGGLHNSRTRPISGRMERELDAYKARKQDQGIRVANWWDNNGGVLQAHECMAHWSVPAYGVPGAVGGVSAVGREFCLRYGESPSVARMNRQLTRVKVVCGGAAVIGMLGSGSPILATGTGVAACTYTMLADKFVDWLPDRRAARMM